MKSLFAKPLFWSNIAAFLVTGFVIVSVAHGWTNPVVAPVGGSGAISADASGNVTIGGNVSWSGFSLTAGSVPWARITGFPADCPVGQHLVAVDGGPAYCAAPGWTYITGKPGACPVGQFVNNAGTGACSAPAGGGTITGSGTAGSLTKFVTATSIGNATSITESGTTLTVAGNLVANGNSWGTQGNLPGPQAFNSSGYWGGAAGGSTGASWSRSCPAGQFMIGIGQSSNGSLVTPFIICAQL